MVRRLATAVFTLSCMHSGVVSALGLGELRLESFLNEPLSATVDIHSAAGLHEDQIRVRLATSDDFEKLGIDRAYFLTSIQFEIQINEQGTGKIIVTSEDPVLEPYLDFLIEARWPTGRLLREYTVLVDPPVFDTTSPVISASERVMETEGGEDASKKPQGAAASTGTRVKTAKSELPPGDMPDREFGSNASASPLAGDQYMIRRDETLWGIALKSKPEGTSVHQTMLDIQRLNPDAFIGGNINRIKAGYIIYLPGSSDISSDDLAGAQKEVQQQNQDWRDGVETQPSRASLRISAQPVQEQEQSATSDVPSESVSSYAGAAENTEELERERTELSDRLAAMEEQVDTLQHIVSLKDDQISALQDALAGNGADEGEAGLALAEIESMEAALEESQAADALAADAADVMDSAPAEAPAVVTPKPAPAVAPVAEEPASNTLYYILGLLLAAAAGAFFFWRRRSSADTQEAKSEAVSRDVFADVKLPDADVELNDTEIDIDIEEQAPIVESELPSDSTLDLDQALDLEPELAQDPEESATELRSGTGYGEGKNDEYASDEAGDALAEADIYIAYGRYPQAVDLLKTAIDNDPQNPAYRVKLAELSAEMGNKEEAQEQYNELKIIGASSDITRVEEVLRGAGNGSDWLGEVSSTAIDSAPGLDEPLELMADLDLIEDSGDALEADFGELEIESPATDILDDDLDLSADFGDEILDEGDEEDLVFAEGGNEMSTKLDLARAYLDMGDEDGAKQILEEVAVEGSAGQKEEAKILLERLD